MATPDDLLELLRCHIGSAAGISVREASEALGCSERVVRHLVTTLRANGHLVCAHPLTGYYVPETVAEGLNTIHFLRRRAMTTLTLLSKMERALIELSGQLRLPT